MPEPEPATIAASRSRSGIGRRITFLALGATLAATLIIAWIGYRGVIASAMRGYDAKLQAVAQAYRDLLPEHYHQAVRTGTVTPEQYIAVCEKLDRLADAARVHYMYSYIEVNGELLNAATSDTPDQRGSAARTPMLDKYKSPPPAIFEALRTGEARFASYTDEFGSFRSIFMPAGEGADRCVVGVDISLGEIQAAANRVLMITVAIALSVSAAVGTLGVWLGNRISRPIADLTRNVATFVDDDFSDDAHAERVLEGISDTDTTETGELAATLLFQQRRLKEYLAAFERATKDKQHIISQLQIAREIQLSLLPKEPPKIDGYEIAGWSEAADQAGGDFYDWVHAASGAVVLTIADVTGHGIGPAIMASVCHAYGRATLKSDQGLSPLVTRLNSLMAADLSDGRFVTHFAAVLYPPAHTLAYVSAGHGPVLIYRAAEAKVEETHVHGLPLGIVADFEFDADSTTTMNPGDVLLMASDGFWEYPNQAGELFGTDRLRDTLKAAAGLSAVAIIERIRAEVAAFTAGVAQPDDMTAVVVKRV